MLVGDDPGAIGVREEQTVELGQEARRRVAVLARARSVRQVEELAPARVTEHDELGPHPSITVPRPLQPDQACTSAVVAGPKAAR